MAESFTPASSNLAFVEYDSDDQTLTVTFHDGAAYRYERVPASVFYGLRSAASAGSYFYRLIKNQFAFERVG